MMRYELPGPDGILRSVWPPEFDAELNRVRNANVRLKAAVVAFLDLHADKRDGGIAIYPKNIRKYAASVRHLENILKDA